MKILFSIFILGFSLQSIAQENDSTFYKKYINKKGIQSVSYLKGYFKNGDLKYEGWAVYKDDPLYEYEESKLGSWIFYYKNSKVKSAYNFGTRFNDTTIHEDFNKQGILTYKSIYKVNESLEATPFKDITKENGKKEDSRFEKVFYYNKHGIYLKGQYSLGAIKQGKWFYYKKGKLKKIKEYKDGKLINVEKKN
jgi:hypothetical protein